MTFFRIYDSQAASAACDYSEAWNARPYLLRHTARATRPEFISRDLDQYAATIWQRAGLVAEGGKCGDAFLFNRCHITIMTTKHPKRPRDPNQLGKLIVDIATGYASDPQVSAYSERASKAGSRGGPARASKLTPEQRADIARNAADARWKKI